MNEFRLTLKRPSGFFAAGCEMREALTLLSDGAFKIYVYVCLHADRRTAQLRFRMAELAHATGHSTRSLTSYLEELRSREVSIVYRAANQHELGRIEICDRFWPYNKPPAARLEDPEQGLYVARVRGLFLEPACVNAAFSAADEKLAAEWYRAGFTRPSAACGSDGVRPEIRGAIQSAGRWTDHQSAVLRRPPPGGHCHGNATGLLAVFGGENAEDGESVACSSKSCAGNARAKYRNEMMSTVFRNVFLDP